VEGKQEQAEDEGAPAVSVELLQDMLDREPPPVLVPPARAAGPSRRIAVGHDALAEDGDADVAAETAPATPTPTG
jgi:hypothetical protein